MKNNVSIGALLIALLLGIGAQAQTIIVVENLGADTIGVKCDTTIVKLGRLSLQVGQSAPQDNNSTNTWVKVARDERPLRFNGHWAAFQMGVNGFANADYSMCAPVEGVPTEFMEVRQAASYEVNWNILEWNVALTPQKNFGLVSGMGISWNNYKFDNRVSINKDSEGNIYPFAVSGESFKKSKLMLCYLTVPLLVEYQFPVNDGRSKMFVSAGVVGGLNVKSLTKIKADHTKSKDRGSLAIEPFKASGMLQVGGNNVSFYATYSFTELFREGRGPELTPFSVGVSLLNLW